MHRVVTLLFALAMVLVAASCGGTSSSTTTTTGVPTTTVVTTTSTVVAGVDALALPVAGEAMGPEWVEELFIPYGPDEAALGTSPGGEGGSMDLGPEFGAQAPDGSWWFLDAAKMRLAHYDTAGAYLGALPVPEALLTNGVYFQYQLPRVLADGTVVAFGLRESTTAVLRAAGGVVDTIEVPALVVPRIDDGTLAYGFGDDGGLAAVDPITGAITPTDWFVTQTGARFRLEVTDGGLRIELPDTGVDRVLPIVTAADPAISAFGAIEVATTADGRIHLLILGASVADETTQLAGYATILPDGTVTPVVEVRNPYTLADTGSPAHLGAAFGADAPWLMVVDLDGVHVYRPA